MWETTAGLLETYTGVAPDGEPVLEDDSGWPPGVGMQGPLFGSVSAGTILTKTYTPLLLPIYYPNANQGQIAQYESDCTGHENDLSEAIWADLLEILLAGQTALS